MPAKVSSLNTRRQGHSPTSSSAPNSQAISHLPESERRRFHVPATDELGHKERLYLRVMPRLASQLDILVGSKVFPYRSVGYLIRHAIIRHLDWLREISASCDTEKVFTEIGQIDVIIKILQEQEEAERFLSVIDKAVTSVNSFIVQGHLNQARRFVLDILKTIDKMPEGYWKMKYHKAVMDRLWSLVHHQPGADLTDQGKDGDRGDDVCGILEELSGFGQQQESSEEGE